MLSYRWWTIVVWWNADRRGLKLGPVTFGIYRWDARTCRDLPSWCVYISVLQRPVVDGGLKHLRW